MKKMNYYIIGGQYENCCYGGAETLSGAKRLATKNKYYMDNWQGWSKPCIYKAEDTREVESCGRITTKDGVVIRVPKENAMPVV